MEESRDDVIPADVAEEFYFTACLENFSSEDLRVLLAHYALPSHTPSDLDTMPGADHFCRAVVAVWTDAAAGVAELAARAEDDTRA
jgi:hypothetical protein